MIDIITNEAVYFEGEKGTTIIRREVPEESKEQVAEVRRELIETLADCDEEIGELFLNEEQPTAEQLMTAIRDRKSVV